MTSFKIARVTQFSFNFRGIYYQQSRVSVRIILTLINITRIRIEINHEYFK